MKKNITIEDLYSKDMIILEAIMGSHAYGTATPQSDTDIRGIFIQPLPHVLKYGWIEQVADEKNDVVFYEIGRFIHLLQQNNPNILEMLAIPEDCLKLKSPEFEYIEKFKTQFLTKKVRWTFAGYAIDQIQKAGGYNKKMNWEEDQMKRKTVLDFCYIIKDNGTVLFNDWLPASVSIIKSDGGEIIHENKNPSYKDYGLSAIDHARDLYALYYLGNYDINKGIILDEEKSNDVQLTSIPKGISPPAYLCFNKDGYSSHCKKYKEYQEWLNNRNENRFKMNKEHGKNYDSKNMMHTYRLLSMAHEMAKGELRVRRTPDEIEKLMKIRKGEYEYDNLLKEAEELISTLDDAFLKSTLPKEVDQEFALDILLKIRQNAYML